MKGISPIIAIVLIIAITVAVAGLVGIWITSFTGTTTGEAERRTTGITECAGIYIKIESMNSSTAPAAIVVSNPATKNKIYITNALDDQATTETLTAVTLNAGALGTVTTSSVPSSGAKKVILKGLCETEDQSTNVTIEGVCKVGSACWP